MDVFVIYFLGFLVFVGFFGAAFTRRSPYPGAYPHEGEYPERLVFWVIGISAALALIATFAN
jgi:hypothetical protein